MYVVVVVMVVVVMVVDTWGDHVGNVAGGSCGVQGRIGVAAVARGERGGRDTTR